MPCYRGTWNIWVEGQAVGIQMKSPGYKLSFLVVFSLCWIWNTTRKPSHQACLSCSFALPPPGSFALHLLNSHQCSVVEAGWGLFESFHIGSTGCHPCEVPLTTGNVNRWTAGHNHTKKTKQNPASVSSVAVLVIGNPMIFFFFFHHHSNTNTHDFFKFF